MFENLEENCQRSRMEQKRKKNGKETSGGRDSVAADTNKTSMGTNTMRDNAIEIIIIPQRVI